MGQGRASEYARVAPDARRLLPTRGEALLIAAFAGVVGVGLIRHPMWFDETQSWNIARASHSLPDLVENLRYEGHPPLWHALLMGVIQITTDVRAMQVLTWVIAVASVAIVITRAPWPLWARIGVCAGYFFVFEYGVFSRSYGLGLLLLLLALASRRASVAWVVWLSLLALTSALGVVLAGSVGLAAIVAGHPTRPDRRTVLAVGTVGIVALASVASIAQPSDSRGGTGFGQALASTIHGRVGVALSGAGRGVVPLPNGHIDWNKNLVSGLPLSVQALFGMVVLAGIAWVLRPWRDALALWVIGSLGLLVFFCVAYPAEYVRHVGHFAILGLAAAWLAGADPRPVDPPRVELAGRAFAVLIVLNVVAGVAHYTHFTFDRRFRPSQHRASVIERATDDPAILSLVDGTATNIGAYLDRPAYSVRLGREIRFVRYDEEAYRGEQLAPNRVAKRAAKLIAESHRDVVVIAGPRRLDDALARYSPGGRKLTDGVYLYAAKSRGDSQD
ncbi:MAG: hypothetical protein WDA60_02210 [Acidimicrobiia bacterium]